MSLSLFTYPSPALNAVIELPASFEKVTIKTLASSGPVTLNGAFRISTTAQTYEFPRIGGHSPYTFKVTAITGTVDALVFIIERFGGEPDADYWTIESVDADGTLHYEESS